jgi:hypothetical protein
VHPTSEASEELAEDQLRAGVQVEEPFGNSEPSGERLPQVRREGLRVVVAARQLPAGRLDRCRQRTKRVLAEEERDPLEPAGALLDERRTHPASSAHRLADRGEAGIG